MPENIIREDGALVIRDSSPYILKEGFVSIYSGCSIKNEQTGEMDFYSPKDYPTYEILEQALKNGTAVPSKPIALKGQE